MFYKPEGDSDFDRAYAAWRDHGEGGLADFDTDQLDECASVAYSLFNRPVYNDDRILLQFARLLERIVAERMAEPVLADLEDWPTPTEPYDPNLIEVDQRVERAAGLVVTLFYDPTDGQTYIRVEDNRDNTAKLVECPPSHAKECFEHPFGMLPELS